MDVANLITFNLVLFAAIASPGPAMLVAIRSTLVHGRAAGIGTGVGLGLMASAWTLLALLGLDGLFSLFPWAYTAFKLGGAAYLIYIALQVWRNAATPIKRSETPARAAAVNGILVNLANPKSVLFAAAVLVVVFPDDLTLLEKSLIVGNHLLVELLFYAGLALLLSTQAVADKYLNAKSVLDRVSAVILGGLGLRLLLERHESV